MSVISRERARFVEQMGQLAEGEGLPRIAGRLLGVLMLDASRCGLDELALELDVSRASISTNVRLLQSMGFIQRITVPGDRRDYWQVPDPSSSLLAVGIRRMRVMQNAIREMRKMAKATSLTDGRVVQIEQLYDQAISRGERLLTRWQQSRRK